MSSSAPTSVVVPAAKGAEAVGVAPTKGGAVLTPMPLSGAGRRGTRRLSKKMLKMLKSMPKAKLLKLAGKKGGAGMEGMEGMEGTGAAPEGGRKRKGSRKTKRRSGLLY